MVPQVRLERTRSCLRQILNLLRLPIPPLGLQSEALTYEAEAPLVNCRPRLTGAVVVFAHNTGDVAALVTAIDGY